MDGLLTGLQAGEDVVRLEPRRANLDQLRLSNRLEMVRVENDVLGVADALHRIDPGLKLLYDKGQEIFVLYWEGRNEDGHEVEQLVGAYRELDQRIVRLVERIDREGRGHADLNRELEHLEAQKDAEQERRRQEQMGPLAEQLRFAVRKDLGLMPGRKRR